MSTILVVDDESAMRELYARAMVAGGYPVTEACTAEEALDFLALNSDVHVVIADLEMPGSGGRWLVEQMRTRFPHVGVILATANDSAPGTLTLQPSVVSYLVKPISGERLRAAVTEALAWRERETASSSFANEGDVLEGWLNKKFTRARIDGDASER